MTAKVLSLLLLVLSSAFAYKLNAPEKCPDNDDMLPCACENMADTGHILVICYEEMRLIQLERVLKMLTGKQNVEMSFKGIDLGTIPLKTFEGIGVIKLEFTDCQLQRLSDDNDTSAVIGLKDTLEELIIRSSFINDDEDKELTQLRIGYFRNLKDLTLSFNRITEISHEWFDNATNLEYLTLLNNKIEKIDDTAFSALSNLKVLAVEGNRFGNLKRSMLPTSADKLESLELENNAFTSLPEDIFSDMSSLSHVSLKSNGIKRLEKNTWETVWLQLDAIYLEDNPLECDSHMTWMFNLKTTSAIYGECRFPKEIEGKTLQDFIDEKGK